MTGSHSEGSPKNVACIGAGPAGLLAATQIKIARPDWTVVVYERSPKDETYGYGVVFSDAAVRTIDFIAPSLGSLLASQVTWDAVEVRARGRRHRSSGHGYVALSRHRLLGELALQALDAGVELRYGTPARFDELSGRYDLVVAADGAGSRTRGALTGELGARLGQGRSRFAWLGTSAEFDAMTFIFEETGDGIAIAHGYPHGDGLSTFVVELPFTREADRDPERERLEQDLGHWSEVFGEHLDGHRLQAKDLRWAHFPTIRLDRCVHRNVVVIGDAAHTVHYSVGSGTRMALEDGFYLARALQRNDGIADALAEYERRRLPSVRDLQAAGERSMRWFENAPACLEKPTAQFSMHLLSRATLPAAGKIRAEAPELVDQAIRVLVQDAHPSPDGVLRLPLDVGGVRFPGRIMLDLTADVPDSPASWGQQYGCVLEPSDSPADDSRRAQWHRLPRGTVIDASELSRYLTARQPAIEATPQFTVVDMRACPPDPARAAAEAEGLLDAVPETGSGRTAESVVAVRNRISPAGETVPPLALEALLARLRVMRSAGLCDLVDLAADRDGVTDPDTVLNALEWADAIRSALGVPAMLSGFRVRPDQVEPHILAGRIDAWCVPGPE